jgi:tetratricopeptide (TPR) repeat protein
MKAIKLITVLLIFFQISAFAGDMLNKSPSAVKLKLPTVSQKDTATINSLVRKGSKYLLSKDHNIDMAKLYIDSAVLICDKKNVDIPSLLHLLLAQYNYITGDLRSASEEAAIALKQSAVAGESNVLARTNLFLGDYYRRTGLYKESLEYYGNAISISKKEGLKGIISWSYYNQALVYRRIGDLKGERQSFQQMIDAAYDENDSVNIGFGYERLSYSFLGDTTTSERRNFRMADSLVRKSLAVSTRIRDTSLIATSLTHLGWNFYLEKMYDSSIFYYEKSLKYSAHAKLYSTSANSLGNLGTIYSDLRNPEKAISYYKKGINQAIKDNDIYELWWIHRDMSNMYLQLRDTSNAYKSYVLFKKYSDMYISKGNSEGLADAKIRYDADTQNKEVELLSLRLKNNRILNYGFAGFIFLAALIGFLLFRGSKLKDTRRISEMNRKISEITQANLRQQMNPHFIFNTLNSIQYYMYQHDKLATNNYLTKFSSLMRKVLDNSQHTSIPLSDELSALNLYLELESIRFKDKFEYNITLDDEIDPLMHKVPTMLIQPYVENSICHGLMPKEGKGLVKIDLKLKEDHILCTIEDNGIGREAAKERNQKKEGSNHNSLGTQITKSRLDLVNELYGTSLHTIYTDLKDESGEPAGTRVEIHIPIIV